MAKSLAVSHFHAGFYQATQLNGVTSSRRFEQFQFALLEASAPLVAVMATVVIGRSGRRMLSHRQISVSRRN
jgi:hypothetical protein